MNYMQTLGFAWVISFPHNSNFSSFSLPLLPSPKSLSHLDTEATYNKLFLSPGLPAMFKVQSDLLPQPAICSPPMDEKHPDFLPPRVARVL